MAWGIIPNSAEQRMLYFLYSFSNPIYIRLFKNDITPDADTVIGDFTQADYTGYAQKSYLTNPAHIATDGNGKATFPLQSFEWFGPTDATPQTIYGWYAYASNDGSLFACGRFDSAPITLNDDTESIKFDLQVRCLDAHQ